ncbi:hypothetical protein D3C71_1465870 [compost metagenome]
MLKTALQSSRAAPAGISFSFIITPSVLILMIAVCLSTMKWMSDVPVLQTASRRRTKSACFSAASAPRDSVAKAASGLRIEAFS